ncbi:Zinc transporter ZIP13 [Amphibalanus amphitrite]|uniref:Zinc transporter ZIP13 n=1 Tax=Amphibalanus amphitrite TaxID=1232801 RepID=A0A6A4VJC1_AMPAM|nr:Zinc transporter ZIP13 [Amphibalanus amphitrite]
MEHAENPSEQIHVGMWVIGGVFFFVLLEMLFSQSLSQEEPEPEPEPEPRPEPEPERAPNGAGELRRRPAGHTVLNGSAAGYLNLLANSVDNFTHGLAIGGSFLASTRIGLLTTFAILIHEIPHEVGDFAILLKSGFSRWEAAKAQLATATLGITGAISALLADDPRALGAYPAGTPLHRLNSSSASRDRTAWILPFTAGGFIHIALVGVLPEVCREREPRQCLKQVLCMAAGVLVMLTVTVAFEH